MGRYRHIRIPVRYAITELASSINMYMDIHGKNIPEIAKTFARLCTGSFGDMRGNQLCPMGYYMHVCPFGADKKCENVTSTNWMLLFARYEMEDTREKAEE